MLPGHEQDLVVDYIRKEIWNNIVGNRVLTDGCLLLFMEERAQIPSRQVQLVLNSLRVTVPSYARRRGNVYTNLAPILLFDVTHLQEYIYWLFIR